MALTRAILGEALGCGFEGRQGLRWRETETTLKSLDDSDNVFGILRINMAAVFE